MLTVEDYELIPRKLLVDKQSIRAIAKELGHSRKTVAKAARHAQPPGYQRAPPPPSPRRPPSGCRGTTAKRWPLSRRVLEPTRRYRAGATFAGRAPFPPQGPADANSRAARASGSNQQLIVRAVLLGAPSRPAAPTACVATSPVVRASARTPKGRLPAHSPSRHTSTPGQRTPAPHQRPPTWRTAPSTTLVRRPRHT
jgi:hypothetical protein